MTKEDKKLLLVDLCSRLPYGVICTDNRHGDSRVFTVDVEDNSVYYTDFDEYGLIENCKPYLRPMSSMTEEERKEYELLVNHCIVTSIGFIHLEAAPLIDWLNKHHFDFRNLIERELAIKVTKENNPYAN